MLIVRQAETAIGTVPRRRPWPTSRRARAQQHAGAHAGGWCRRPGPERRRGPTSKSISVSRADHLSTRGAVGQFAHDAAVLITEAIVDDADAELVVDDAVDDPAVGLVGNERASGRACRAGGRGSKSCSIVYAVASRPSFVETLEARTASAVVSAMCTNGTSMAAVICVGHLVHRVRTQNEQLSALSDEQSLRLDRRGGRPAPPTRAVALQPLDIAEIDTSAAGNLRSAGRRAGARVASLISR